MTPREKALLVSSPGLTVLILGLAWWAIDRQLMDRSIRFLDTLHDCARL